MAAPKVLHVCQLHHHMCKRLPFAAIHLPFAQVQVRHRSKNKNQRTKAPPTATEKDVFIPRKHRLAAEAMKNKVINPQERYKGREPQDDVWLRLFYPRPKHSLERALLMHSELAQPAMLDNMQGVVLVELELDMQTKKKTKFLSNFKNTIQIPHNFEEGAEPRILAFCKKSEDQLAAEKLGAVYVGAADLAKRIESREIVDDEYDFVISTLDAYPDVVKIRKYLKDKLPQKIKGNLSDDVEGMMKLFLEGKTYESKKISESTGSLEFSIGRLDMTKEKLMENFFAYVDAICTHGRSPGPFITKAYVTCPPSKEKFQIVADDLLPSTEREKQAAAIAQAAEEEEEEEEEEVLKNTEEDSDDEGEKQQKAKSGT